MVNLRSHCRNYFVLLALMLLLPCAAAFAASAQFTVNVADEAGNPVPGCRVIVWDKNQPWNNYTQAQSTTGQIEVTLPNVYMTTDSATNPENNIAFVIIPPRDIGNSQLTWKYAEKLFYPFDYGSGPDEVDEKPLDVVLENGVLVKIKPTFGTSIEPVAGVINKTYIYANDISYNLPMDFRAVYTFEDIDIQANSEKEWHLYWPTGKTIFAENFGDGKANDLAASSYYEQLYQSAFVGQTETLFSFFHPKKPKGLVEVNVRDELGAIKTDYEFNIQNHSGLWLNTTSGQASFYIPYGTYDFRMTPTTVAEDAIVLRPRTVVGAEKVVVDIAPANGVDATCDVTLGDINMNDLPGEISSALGGTQIKAERKFVDSQGSPFWADYQWANFSGYGQTGNAYTYTFYNKFEPGTYRFSTNNGGWVVDRSVEPFKCYEPYKTVEIDLNSTSNKAEIVLPQRLGLFVKVSSDETLWGQPMASIIEGGDHPYGYSANWKSEITFDYTNNVYKMFIAYLNMGERVVVRADLPPNNDPANIIPEAVKFFAPIEIKATGTTNIDETLMVNSTDFITVSGDVLLNGESYSDPDGLLTLNPMIQFANGLEVPTKELGLGDPMQKAFSADPGFAFRLEKGRVYRFFMNEPQSSTMDYQPLDGFVPYEERYPAPDTDVTDKIITLSKGGAVNGKLLNDGADLPPGAQVQIEVEPISQSWYDYQVFNRVGWSSNTEPGVFMVSGLKTGEYKFAFNIDGVTTDFYARDENGEEIFYKNYGMQTMPLVSRKVFVDETKPAANLEFNLDSSSLRYLAGKIVDTNGNPISGLWLQIVRRPEGSVPDMMEPGYHYHFDEKDFVFFCMTDEEGNLIAGSQTDYASEYIPLEFGSYDIYAVGIGQVPDGVIYDLNLEPYPGNWGSLIGSIDITPFDNPDPTMPVPFEAKIGLRYDVAGTITVDSEPYQMNMQFQAFDENFNFAGEGYHSLNASGETEVWKLSFSNGLKPGNFWVKHIETDNTFGGLLKLYLENFTVTTETNQIALDFVTPQQSVIVNTNFPQNADNRNIQLSIVPDFEINSFGSEMWAGSAIPNNQGQLEIFLPDLPEQFQGYRYALQLWDLYVQEEIFDENGFPTGNFTYKKYAPATRTVFIEPGQNVDLEWIPPTNVTVTVTNAPTTNIDRYIGVLMHRDMFEDGADALFSGSFEGTHNDNDRQVFFATLKENHFDFTNVVSDRDYVFFAYESLWPVMPHELEWADRFMWQAVFRHFHDDIQVGRDGLSGESAVQVTFRELANLKVETAPENFAFLASDIKLGITEDPLQTNNLPAWPLIMPVMQPDWQTGGYMMDYPVPMPFEELMVPVDWAIRAAFIPEKVPGGEKYQPKVDENIFVGAEGKIHVMQLKLRTMISGLFAYRPDPALEPMPVEGKIYFVKDGTDPMNPKAVIKVTPENGFYQVALAPGNYSGCGVPLGMGATTFFRVVVEPETSLPKDIFVKDGLEISGKVVDQSGMPAYGAAVNVLRKASPISTEFDGQPFLPYQVFIDNNEIVCGPDGSFFFNAEPNVDYYLQPTVEFGFNPAKPVKVELRDTAKSEVQIVLTKGLMINGFVKEKTRRIKAIPAVSEFQEQFGSIDPIEGILGKWNEERQAYEFKILGLAASMSYDIEFWPEDEAKTLKKYTNVLGWAWDPAEIVKFGDGYSLKGRLLNKVSGLPIEKQGVKVKLILSLPMEYAFPDDGMPDMDDPPIDPPTDPFAANAKFRIMANGTVAEPITMPTPEDFMFADMQEFEAETDATGRYEFKGIPQFISAFLLVEQAVAGDGFDYAVARGEDFPSTLTDTVKVMENIDIKLQKGGTIIGRLIDAKGQPIIGLTVDAYFEENEVQGITNSTGNFAIKGLVPAPAYRLEAWTPGGMTPVFRANIQVEAGKTTDVGVMPISAATFVFGEVKNHGPFLQRLMQQGMIHDAGLEVLAFDNDRVVSDIGMLSKSFVQHIIGQTNVYADIYAPEQPEMTPFGIDVRPGSAQLGVIYNYENANKVSTILSWGWKPQVAIPSPDQFEVDSATMSFDLGIQLECPVEFGVIVGTLTNVLKPDAPFTPQNTVIAFYPVDAAGKLIPVPMPTAITSPFEGKWSVRNLPVGSYKIKVVTKDYGVHLLDTVQITKDHTLTNPKKIGLKIGGGQRQIVGKVLVGNTETGLAAAKVNLVLHKLVTSTDAEGNYSFYMPVNSFFMPQIEVSKPGYETTRVASFPSVVATSGITLTPSDDPITLTPIRVSDQVARAEVLVKDHDGKGKIGAEVTMVVKTVSGTVEEKQTDGSVKTITTYIYVPAEVQLTDETGRAVFTTVPKAKELRFNARAFYRDPVVKTVTAAENTGNITVPITFAEPKPRIFYNGKIVAEEGGTYKLNGRFDFNMPVAIGDLKYFLGANQETLPDANSAADANPYFRYPDKIGTNIMAMEFKRSQIADPDPSNEVKTLMAKMFYKSTDAANLLGEFNVFEGMVFRLQTKVDPTSSDGFTARQTDETGNQLPVGLTVPPGMLDPEITQFTMTVASPTEDVQPITNDPEEQAKIDALPEEKKPKLAGPKFKFNFGKADGSTNFGEGTQHQGLFEITIPYDPTAVNFEPRWWDAGNNKWSKIGILPDSIKPGVPSEGYVTFKVSHLTEFAVIKNLQDAILRLRCDYNGDQKIDINDLIYQIAWLQADKTTNAQTVAARALEIFPNIVKPEGELNLPSELGDDLTGEGSLDLNDLILLIAYLQADGTSNTATINSRAKEIYTNINGEIIDRMPGDSITK